MLDIMSQLSLHALQDLGQGEGYNSYSIPIRLIENAKDIPI